MFEHFCRGGGGSGRGGERERESFFFLYTIGVNNDEFIQVRGRVDGVYLLAQSFVARISQCLVGRPRDHCVPSTNPNKLVVVNDHRAPEIL